MPREPTKSSLLVAAVVLLLVSPALAGLATGQSVGISLTVDGQSVSAGDQSVVPADPTVGVEARADGVIRTVILRVDGTTVETFEPDESTFSRTYVPALSDGRNELTVVVETDDGVDSRRITVTKDRRAPFVRFTAPFETDHHRDVVPETVRVNASTVTISGELHDDAGVEHVTITRRFVNDHANAYRLETARWDVEDPGGTFSREIFLGNGTNEVRIQVTDALGQTREYELELVVVDEEAPRVELSLPETVGRSTLDLRGQVTDNVQVDGVAVSVGGTGETTSLFTGVDQEPDPSAVSVPLDGTVRLRPGENTVVVTATDLAGHTTTASQTVVYEDNSAPEATIDRTATRFVGDGSLRVRGVVSGGTITGVTVESVATDSEEVVDLARVYQGTPRSTVALDETLDLADGETRVVVRYTDGDDRERRTAFLVDPASESIHWEAITSTPSGEEDGGPTTARPGDSTPTETATGEPTTVEGPQALVAVEGLPGFTPVTAAVAVTLLALLVLVGRRRAR